jgi:hypothetical protein
VACMSRFVDQFVVLFDASKPPILVTVRTDTNTVRALRSILVLGGAFVRYSSRSERKNQGREAAFIFVGMPFARAGASQAHSRSVQRLVWRSDAHMRLAR